MKIVAVEVWPWDVPMRAPYRSAQRVTTLARNVLVRVTLEDGSAGFGESAPAQYVTGERQSTVADAARGAAAGLIGKAVADVLAQIAAQVHTAPGAFGALEMALLDASARFAGLPLCRHLGAAQGAPVEAVTDLSLPLLSASEAVTRAARAAADGFRHLKIKVGGDFAEDVARTRAVASAAPEASLRLDGNQGFSPEDALTLLEEISDLLPRIALFEQPTKAGDDTAMAFVSARAPVPVFADESVHTPEDARRLVGNGVCGGVVLKVAKSGISGARAIADVTHAAGGQCLFGCMMETRVAVGAALHLALTLGEGAERPLLLDLDGHLLTDDSAHIDGGFTSRGDVLAIDPRAPGLGLVARHVPVL